MGAIEAIVDDDAPFFAPADTDMVDGLIGRYQKERDSVEQVHAFFSGDGFHRAVGYYIAGNRNELTGLRYAPATEKMFNLDGAIKALNAAHWDNALRLTDVLDFMPAKRREEWFESIEKMQTPGFEEDTVRATLGSLLAQRMRFLAEKVDGIFQALSRTHVTNQPEGFGKRMILTGVTHDYGGYARSQTGHINDLRQIIAKFMGRDEPGWKATNRVVEIARDQHRGEWIAVDGGALRIRCYLNGNAHLEVHPDMAWRLNQILAHFHPAAIPSEFRTKPRRKAKSFTLMERPLPFAVLELLQGMRKVNTSRGRGLGGREVIPDTTNPNSLRFDYGEKDKYTLAEAERVLEAIGGVKHGDCGSDGWEFDYAPGEIINTIIASGCIPDHKSHQFYPTPKALAEQAIELAEIGDYDQCLEPSAGTGGLVDLMPKERTTCVEISSLHCHVLRKKGVVVREGDFLAVAETCQVRFDRIIMNPPYSQGRWQAHIEAAAGLLKDDGRLVAILPASAKGKDVLPGFNLEWSRIYENQFRGASVSVVIMTAQR